jgi:Ca2+-binding RTX toxin-like protein
VFKQLVPTLVFGSVLVSAQVLAVGPEVTKDKFPHYHPAHTVIKCPYLPKGLVDIPTCDGHQATCVGTDGHDLILGSDGNDVIVAGAGNDLVHADAADDIVCGGPGDDSLFGARGLDTLYGESGNDWLFGAADPNNLYGGEGDYDVLWGGPSMLDYLEGGSGTHDVCMLQGDNGDYDTYTCNTAIRVKDECRPAYLDAPSSTAPEEHADEQKQN